LVGLGTRFLEEDERHRGQEFIAAAAAILVDGNKRPQNIPIIFCKSKRFFKVQH